MHTEHSKVVVMPTLSLMHVHMQVDLMDHPLHTITYVADIDHVLVIMAHILPPRPPPSQQTTNGTAGEAGEYKYIPKMTCHVLDSSNVRSCCRA